MLRAIRKHFPQPPENVLSGNAIDKFLDDPELCEDKLSEEAGSDGFLDSIMKVIYPDSGSLKQPITPAVERYKFSNLHMIIVYASFDFNPFPN